MKKTNKRTEKGNTKEGGRIEMGKFLKDKKRNHANSFGCNNSSTFDISGSKHKLSVGQKWNNPKK